MQIPRTRSLTLWDRMICLLLTETNPTNSQDLSERFAADSSWEVLLSQQQP